MNQDPIQMLANNPKKRKYTSDNGENSSQNKTGIPTESNSQQDKLKSQEFIRLTILKLLRDSPHQKNTKNVIKSLHSDLTKGFDKVNYESEIKSMMRSVGEVKNVDVESVRILEEESKKYLKSLINKVTLIAQLRLENDKSSKKKRITLDDFAKSLLPDCRSIRMVQYIIQSINLSKSYKSCDESEYSFPKLTCKFTDKNEDLDWKPSKEIEDEIEKIDNTWTLERVKNERSHNIIANFAKDLSKEDYLEWHNNLKISFLRPHKKEKFIEFLELYCGLKDFKLDKLVIEALGFLAKDHIQNITIKAIQLKKNPNEPIDPISLKAIVDKIRSNNTS